MAKQTEIRYVDDLDGSDAVGTVEFGIDGKNYEIDLSEENANRLREGLSPFIDVARRPERGRGRALASVPNGRKSSSKQSEGGVNRAEVQEWARENGYIVKDRGRLSKQILNAYHEAHGSQSVSA